MAQTQDTLRLLLLADVNSTHTQKWAISLAAKGFSVGIFSLSQLKADWLKNFENISLCFTPETRNSIPFVDKLLYPSMLPDVRRVIKEFKPDIVHAHYASSYGLLGALSGFHPYVLSVWGSDVFEFPRNSFMHKKVFTFNLKRADKVCSTSYTMREEIKKYSDKDVTVIPFGVDLAIFKPFYAHHVFPDDAIVIGTIKALEKSYGIEYLVDAFGILRKRLKGYRLKLMIAGKGSLDAALRARVKELGIEADTVFTGYIAPVEVPAYHNMFTITVFPSLNESFGVSVVEAMACEKPVVVSNVGGLPEVVEDGVTGMVVPKANAEQLAHAIEKLVKDSGLRAKYGKQGRLRVEKLYNWENNLSEMIRIYRQVCSQPIFHNSD